ncbi:MAG: D-alanyl-D-alanine carboxypeptidase/D-alanyl-D-alanine-endopeptidase [Cyclobacteriaceae bacterium]
MMRLYSFILVCLLAVACSPASKHALTKRFNSLETRLHDHTGFMLYDPEQKRELYSYQSDKYFTPASNTKIFTFYTSLVVLGDSVPGLRYLETNDSLIFSGTGDPSLLYENIYDPGKTFSFLSTTNKKLFMADGNFYTDVLGPGWAWDDLPFTYSSERSPLPVYGNYFTLQQSGNKIKTTPSYFSFDVTVRDSTDKSSLAREMGSNKMDLYPGRTGLSNQWKTPFKTSSALTAKLLSDTLKKEVTVINRVLPKSEKTLYSIPVDSLFKEMMQESDNFIAEQLLLTCAGVLSDSLKPEIAIQYMKKNYLADLPDEPVWIDGSGLSRYNLFTPRSIVSVWEKIYLRVPRARLFPLLAIGGKTGTVKRAYKNEPPYLYGKTGTLSNNHCLSGYLVTKKGRTLIFSFMSNNHPAPASTIRAEMEKILKDLYLHY